MNYEKYLCKSKLNPPFVFNIAKVIELNLNLKQNCINLTLKIDLTSLTIIYIEFGSNWSCSQWTYFLYNNNS